MQNSKVHFTQRKHLVCVCVGGGAFKFKEEKKPWSAFRDDRGLWEQKVVERKTRQQPYIMVKLNQELTTSPPSSIGSLL